jgi:hypothetical protein
MAMVLPRRSFASMTVLACLALARHAGAAAYEGFDYPLGTANTA